MDFNSWAQTSEEVGEAPFTTARDKNIVLKVLCWLFFNCEDNNNYNIGKMVYLTGVPFMQRISEHTQRQSK